MRKTIENMAFDPSMGFGSFKGKKLLPSIKKEKSDFNKNHPEKIWGGEY